MLILWLSSLFAHLHMIISFVVYIRH